MGTAGPIRLAKELLTANNHSGQFILFNSDIICEYPVHDMLEFHNNHGGEITMMITSVEDPSKYGVVLSDEDGRVQKFIEKPKDFIGNMVNAGLYIFNLSAIDRIEMRPHFLERELFPKLADEGLIYSMNLTKFWMDIGQPKDFLIGSKYYL